MDTLRHRVPWFFNYCSGYLDTVTGTGSITLPKAKANGLKSVKLFGGTEQRNLPSGYTQVEYLGSNSQAYIDTGIEGDNNNLEIGCTFSYSNKITYGAVYGNYISDNDNSYRIILGNTTDTVYVNVNTKGDNIGTSTSQASISTINKTTIKQFEYTVNSNTYQLPQRETGTTNNTKICLFNRSMTNPNTTRNIGLKVYDFYIKDNNVLVCNLIPCRRNSDSVLGMYDTVTNTFLTNAGTGTFTAGADVVPTPSRPIDIVSNNGVLKLSPNLFDTNKPTLNLAYVTPRLVTNAERYGKYLKVEPNTTYTISRTDSYFLNLCESSVVPANGITASYTAMGNVSAYTITTQSTTKYLYIYSAVPVISFNLQVELGSTATPYIPYGQIYTDGTVETVEVMGKNLFNKATISKYTLLSTSTGETLPQQEEWSWCSDFIQVSSSITYYFKSGTNWPVRIFWYDGNKNYLSRNYAVLDSSFTVGSTCKFIRFHIGNNAGGQAMYEGETMISLGSTATTYEPYYNGGSATAEMLLKVGDYQDEQSILDGEVTRNIGIKVFDGTEDWQSNQGNNIYTIAINGAIKPSTRIALISSHFVGTNLINANMPDNSIKLSGTTLSETYGTVFIRSTNYETASAFKQFLATQYANGTPVTVIYPLATATTETVTPQTLQVQVGTNVLQITQASIDNLPLEVTYKRGK